LAPSGNATSKSSTVVQMFPANATVKQLFADVANLYADRTKNFDLITTFPKQSLLSKLNLTLIEAGLSGCQVIMQWI
jgi:hypothetical protein